MIDGLRLRKPVTGIAYRFTLPAARITRP